MKSIKNCDKKVIGITLISLAIAILVILIVAGVSIAMLTGNNSIIKQTEKAKEQTETAAENELIQLILMNYNIEENKILDLRENGEFYNDVKRELGNEKFEYKVFNERIAIINNRYIINEKGKIYELNGTFYSRDIEDLSSLFYGIEIGNYSCPINTKKQENNKELSVKKWKLFFADTENVYLIAGNPIKIEDIEPKIINLTNNEQKNVIIGTGDSEYTCGNWNDVIPYYNGIEDIGENKILNYLHATKKCKDNSTASWKAVAYMLDTQVWRQFSGENANFAIGAPTLEMFLKSYNDVSNNPIRYILNEKGFYEYKHLVNMTNNIMNYVESGHASSLIASPVDHQSLLSATTNYIYNICYYNTWYTGQSFFPVVCLKSDTKFKINVEEKMIINIES